MKLASKGLLFSFLIVVMSCRLLCLLCKCVRQKRVMPNSTNTVRTTTSTQVLPLQRTTVSNTTSNNTISNLISKNVATSPRNNTEQLHTSSNDFQQNFTAPLLPNPYPTFDNDNIEHERNCVYYCRKPTPPRNTPMVIMSKLNF